MAHSDDVGEVTRYLLSLVENPQKLAEFKRNPNAALEASRLSEGAISLIKSNRPVYEGDKTVIVIALIIIVVA